MHRHLEREIDRLKRKILSLASLVESNLEKAVTAIETRDVDLARTVVEADAEIDRSEVDVEEECMKILALHQPVAVDLRYLIAVLKLNNDLERIGDLAVNLADLATSLAGEKISNPEVTLYPLAQKAQWMLGKSLDALIHRDSDLARRVCAADDEVDALDLEIYSHVLDTLRTHPEAADSLIPILEASHQLERVADHATNIAEDVIYTVEGDIVRHRKSISSPRQTPPRPRRRCC